MASEFPGFGARLRYERERRKVSIASIAESTKILGALLEGLENDDVSRWPTGLYRRAFMRAYASAIGLDPDATVKEFLERFPDPEPAPAAAPALAPAKSAPASTEAASEPPVVSNDVIRMSIPRLGAWFAGGSRLSGVRLRCLAAGLDLFVVWVIAVAMFAVFGELWAPLAIVAALYYASGILLLGNTPGVCMFAEPIGANGASRASGASDGSGASGAPRAPLAPFASLAPVRWLRRVLSASSDDARPHPDTPSRARSAPFP